jgi:hypothetical protein
MMLADIKAAVTLWRWIGEECVDEIREFIREDDDYSLYVADEDNFNNDDEYAVLVAKTLLANKVSEGLREFPATNQLAFENDRFVNQINPRSAVGFIWSIISDDLMSGRSWHYKQCRYCGAWEDMSKPGLRRSIWTHCDKEDCKKAHLREKNKERARKYRQQRRGGTVFLGANTAQS